MDFIYFLKEINTFLFCLFIKSIKVDSKYMLRKIFISNKCCSSYSSKNTEKMDSFHKNIKQFSTWIIIRNVS